MIDFWQEARLLRPILTHIRRELHQYPELGWREIRATQLIEEQLHRLGAQIVPWGSMTGAVGLLQGARPGRTVALRADIDALPLEEHNAAPYRSQRKGIMHACGHDGHVACALGAAMLLAEHARLWRGTVKLIFQPAEETGGGAELLIGRDVLHNPEVNAIFALHCQPELPTGYIGLREGALMAANDFIDITITGKSGHGALPHRARDPIAASAAILQALANLHFRGIDPLQAAVISFGKINGGTARNIIPNAVEMEGTIRTLEPALRTALLPQVADLIGQVAAAYGTEATASFPRHFPAVINPAGLAGFCRRSLAGTEAKLAASEPVMLTEDFALFQQKIPGVLLWLGVGNREKGLTHPLHSDRFDLDEDALAFGAAALAKLAFDYLDD